MMKKPTSAIEALKLVVEMEVPDATKPILVGNAHCASYGQFEKHVIGRQIFDMKQLAKINECPQCQKTLNLFKNVYGVSLRAVAAETLAQIGNLLGDGRLVPLPQISQGNFVRAAQNAPMRDRTYPVTIVGKAGQAVDEGLIIINRGPILTDKNELVMNITVSEPKYLSERLPIELSLVSLSDGEIITSFDLPGVASQDLKTKLLELPQIAEMMKQLREAPKRLPFGFVIRALGKGVISAKTPKTKQNPVVRYAPTLHL